MITLLKKIPFFLLLLVAFFCLHGTVENYGYLNLTEVINLGLIITLCFIAFFILIWVFSKNYIFTSLFCFFIGTLYLFFGAIHDWIKSIDTLSFFHSYTVLLPILFFLSIFCAWFLLVKKYNWGKLYLFLNILFLIFCISDTILLIQKYFRTQNIQSVSTVNFDYSKITHKPNVYYLLFDEYAGYESLKDSFAFRNDSLYNFLQQKEFKILPTFSNYEFTPFSMSSIFNMQYVDSNYNHQLVTQTDIQNRFGEIRSAEVFSIFKKMNYLIENLSIFDIKERPALLRSSIFFPIHTILLTNKIFHVRIIKDLIWNFLTGKNEILFIKRYFSLKEDIYNKKVEEKVLQSSTTKSDIPKFTYGHFLLPHGQYYRDSIGKFNSFTQMVDLYNKSLYLSYLKYTNTIIQNLVNQIVKNDPNSIMIIMSDHGYHNYLNKGIDAPYNYNNFCLVRFPNKNYMPYRENWSTVNFFRYLFNCEFGQNLPYLKDSSIYVNN